MNRGRDGISEILDFPGDGGNALICRCDVTDRGEERLCRLAWHDDLTGLYNRRALAVRQSRRLAARSLGPVAISYPDLDRLKPINDYLGHTGGDRFIRAFRAT